MTCTSERVLETPMGYNDAGAATIREYLLKLLSLVWKDGEGFNGKRPFGNSSWEYELLAALAQAGLIQGEKDEWGYWDYDPDDDDYGRLLIQNAIQAL